MCVIANFGSLHQLLYAVRNGRADLVLDLLEKRAYTESQDNVRENARMFSVRPVFVAASFSECVFCVQGHVEISFDASVYVVGV